MQIEIKVSVDSDDKQILALYVRVANRKVKKTVEIAEGSCYVDVDSRGRTVGIEMIAPGSLKICLKDLKSKIDADSLEGVIKDVREVVQEIGEFVAA